MSQDHGLNIFNQKVSKKIIKFNLSSVYSTVYCIAEQLNCIVTEFSFNKKRYSASHVYNFKYFVQECVPFIHALPVDR